ncbi:fasciclin-2 isoform X2 [Chelonus insularis]|uniref:fasciclin-2 isoform X2 n=1 Tax=Chelonus insularis TaxID=460826 RepID=UPI00158D8A89|nr:fasciclin-2 isoform X2 [Chelonus insularis]
MTKPNGSFCISILCIAFNVIKTPNNSSFKHSWTNGQTSLEILPTGDKHSKPSGVRLIFTCKLPTSGDANLVEIEWLGPNMNRIESRHSYTSNLANIHLYTEKHQDNSLSLVFNPLKEELSGRYTCVGSYAGAEKINKSLDIETIETITFKNAPEYQYATLGEEYKIRCEVKARPAPTVDWFKDNERLITGDHYIVETHALKINQVRDDDKGVYTCHAAVLQTGELQERLITLEVQEKPKINEVSSEIEIIEGRAQKIDICNATGKPAPKYSWLNTIRKVNLSEADRFYVDRDTGILQITNVQDDDEGEYQCIAENVAGSAMLPIRVNVLKKPKIMEFQNKTVVVGKEVKLECKVYGKPAPGVTFRKQTASKSFVLGNQPNDDRIVLRTYDDNTTGKTTAVLTISNVLREDDGLYECIAKNKVEEARKNGHLTVEFPPSFASMINQTVWSWDRRPVNLTCIAESIPNATIQWFHGDRPLFQQNVHVDDTIVYKQFGKGPNSTLNIIPSDARYYGFYKCKASNIHGESTHTIQLNMGEKPKAIPQARISTITATTISFDIVPPPMHPELPIKTITVQYKTENEFWTTAKNKTWSLNSPYVLENLLPQVGYEFRFHATNDVGDGPWGSILQQMMPVRSVPQTPKMLMNKENVEYDTSMYSNQYKVKWLAPLDNGDPIDKYELRICEIKRVEGDWQLQERTCRVDEIKGQRDEHYVKDLTPDRYYSAQLKAHNSIGYSEAGILQFRTAKALHGPVLHQGPLISSAAIIGIVIAILLLIIVIIDIICCCAHKTGIIFYLCERSKRKPVDEEDAKLGSLYGWRFPLPYCDQKMANVAGVTAIQDSSSGKNTIKLVKHTAM